MKKLTVARIRTIVARQKVVRWGPKYVPSILANSKEAPSRSKPTRTYSALLQRHVHALSVTETAAVGFALYHPALFELKEQHMLSFKQTWSPLAGHPKADGLKLPSSAGVLAIAKNLDRLAEYPRLKDVKAQKFVPAPILGDFLLFLADENGPYCVEWDIKRDEGAHGKPFNSEDSSPGEARRAALKYEIYTHYMRDMAIRVVPVHLGTFDEQLRKNLRRLVLLHSRSINLHPELQVEITEGYRECVKNGDAPLKVVSRYVKRGTPTEELLSVLNQAIWYRTLGVDLFTPIATDWPLLPETRDPLDVYRNLYAR